MEAARERITVAIMALGGQGGGVLADWILDVANHNGFVAQGTSVPGVAQRTGSTVYYIEMAPRPSAGGNQPDPVLALMPAPGDVDVVIASELMEAGRAMVRGFVTADRTALVASTHRIYAISEKSALGEGRASSERILEAAQRRAARFIGFDMDAAATQSRSVISSVMFGALAGSGALPFPPEAFEHAIRRGRKAVDANLKGFAAGLEGARAPAHRGEEIAAPPEPTTEQGRALKARILERLPRPAQDLAILGVARLMDYQDVAYAKLYLDRLERMAALDGDRMTWRLTAAVARHLALWMAYEDTIRVADLKVRTTRRGRLEQEVRLTDAQVLAVTEYMHPRLQEVCDTLPAALGRFILTTGWLRRALEPRFAKGRHVRTTSLRWMLALQMLGGLRRIRRSTLRYREEQRRIESWLQLVASFAQTDTDAAAEIVESQTLIKGYGDTFERGLANFEAIMAAARAGFGQSDTAGRVRAWRAAALADDTGCALQTALKTG